MQFQPVRNFLGLRFRELQNLTVLGGDLFVRLGFCLSCHATLSSSQQSGCWYKCLRTSKRLLRHRSQNDGRTSWFSRCIVSLSCLRKLGVPPAWEGSCAIWDGSVAGGVSCCVLARGGLIWGQGCHCHDLV